MSAVLQLKPNQIVITDGKALVIEIFFSPHDIVESKCNTQCDLFVYPDRQIIPDFDASLYWNIEPNAYPRLFKPLFDNTKVYLPLERYAKIPQIAAIGYDSSFTPFSYYFGHRHDRLYLSQRI